MNCALRGYPAALDDGLDDLSIQLFPVRRLSKLHVTSTPKPANYAGFEVSVRNKEHRNPLIWLF